MTGSRLLHDAVGVAERPGLTDLGEGGMRLPEFSFAVLWAARKRQRVDVATEVCDVPQGRPDVAGIVEHSPHQHGSKTCRRDRSEFDRATTGNFSSGSTAIQSMCPENRRANALSRGCHPPQGQMDGSSALTPDGRAVFLHHARRQGCLWLDNRTRRIRHPSSFSAAGGENALCLRSLVRLVRASGHLFRCHLRLAQHAHQRDGVAGGYRGFIVLA